MIHGYLSHRRSGILGSNLVEVLAKEHQITVLDNFHTGSMENLKDLQKEVRVLEG